MPEEGLELPAELERVRRELGEDGGPSGTRRLRVALFALLDQVAGLRRKSEVDVFAVAPTWFVPPGGAGDPGRVRLAGDFLSGFGGFFDRRYREHDFALGRAVAGSVLSRPPAMGPDPSIALLADPDDRPRRPGKTPEPDPRHLRAAKRRFGDRLGHVAAAVVKDSLSDPVVRLLGAAIAGYLAPRSLKATRPLRDVALFRIRVRARKDRDVFFLAPRRGAAGERRTARRRRPADLLTVVRFSPRGRPAAMEGPHVYRKGNRYRLEIRRQRARRGDASREITLPPLSVLRQRRDLALPIFETAVQWDEAHEAKWTVVEGLHPLEESLGSRRRKKRE